MYKLSYYIFPLMLGFLSMDTIAAINVYGPGGPAPAMHEAAKQFKNKTGIDVHVTAGPTSQWADKAKLDADVIYSGSEAMMSDFESVFAEKIVKEKVIFTTHTPEDAGNEEHDINLLHKFGFFNTLTLEKVREITLIKGDKFNLTIGALRAAKRTNAVSALHGVVSNRMWKDCEGASEITYITNAQNKNFWMDKQLLKAFENDKSKDIIKRKKVLKQKLFKIQVK